MFTGIIAKQGTVRSAKDARTERILEINVPSFKLKEGDSLAVNGACLTVVKKKSSNYIFNVVPETLHLTNLGRLARGSKVNLELPMRLGDRLNGHLVLGHIDDVSKVLKFQKTKKSTVLRVALSKKYQRYVVRKGSVALDGVSLTVAAVGKGWLEVALIPYTLSHTTLGKLKKGDIVNIEFDIFARYLYAPTN
jgi:riboflavin synthase